MKRSVLVAVAICVAAASGFFVQRHFAPPIVAAAAPSTATAPTAPAAETSEDPAAEQEAAAQKIPDVLPQFQLADLDGKNRSLKDWSGRPLIVNFWATWCGPCRKEIPLLNQIRKQHAAQRLEIVGIAMDFREDVIKYTKETSISYPLLIGEDGGPEAMVAMGMKDSGFPFTFFADSKQRIVAMKLGELHQNEADLIIEKVIAVDAGKMDLKTAREQITEGMKEITLRKEAAEGAEKATKSKSG